MYLEDPVQALTVARHALSPGGVLVAATWAEPKRVAYYTLPKAALARFASVPPIDPDVPGEFYYADPDRLVTDLALAGFVVQHMEEFEVDVMEVTSNADLIAWARAFGMSRLLDGMSTATVRSWERELVRLAELFRNDGFIRLGGIARLVVASVANGNALR